MAVFYISCLCEGLYGWQRLPHGPWKRLMLSSLPVGRTEEQSGPGCEDIGVDIHFVVTVVGLSCVLMSF